MADNEQDQDDEPCEEAFYDSINKSGTEELNMPAMYLRRLKDVNRKFQQEVEKKKRLSPGHAAEQAEPAHETDEEIPAAPGLFASGEHQIGSAPPPESPPIIISSEPAPSVQQPAPAEDAALETAEPIGSKPSSVGGRLNLSLPPKP